MIVYKWVYKKDNKYYSLMNYGFCRLEKRFLTNQLPYEIGKTYISDEKEAEKLKQEYYIRYKTIPRFLKSGFYFWDKNYSIPIPLKNKMIKIGSNINATLKCEIEKENILSFERGNKSIRAKKFKILKEV